MFEDKHSIFIGLFKTEDEFFASFEQPEITEYFDIDTGEYFSPSSNLAINFGFDCYDEDHVDYVFLDQPVSPNLFLDSVTELYGEDRFKYWNTLAIKNALDVCNNKQVEKVNCILYIGSILEEDITQNRETPISQKYGLMYCGTYFNAY